MNMKRTLWRSAFYISAAGAGLYASQYISLEKASMRGQRNPIGLVQGLEAMVSGPYRR